MNILSDVIEVNKEALQNTVGKLRYVPLLAVAYVVYQFITFLVGILGSQLGSGIGFLWGFIVYFVNIAIMAHFLTLLLNVIRYGRLRAHDLISQQFMHLVSPLIQAFFIIYLIELVFNIVLSSFLPGFITLLVLFLWEGAKMPVQESVYLGNHFGYGALMHTLQFWKDNWAQWLVPVITGLLVQLIILPRIQQLFYRSIWLLPLVWFISGLGVAAWMIWRGELFVILNAGSLRSREHRRRTY